ncbi:Cytochrome b subunit of formate dehydrogenase [Sporomusa malonica]|uniref:Cytochrome b subunit of formate dehydrogenase n=1 Tax=Sporomusa malonica TaxID=112901 RepID=A0A1W1Z6V8_9FIRM|nr:Cytochrome b subunit of formate dehydrogenase [Sporomusa malonica]
MVTVKLQLEFVVHWLLTVVFAVLTISGLAMIGARYGWLLNYDIATADFVHRVIAVPYILLAFLALGQELARVLKDDSQRDLGWGIFGRQEYGLFTLLTTLLFIVTGIILWKSHHGNKAALAFAMFVHEKLTYIVLASLVWHMYQKAHAFVWPKQQTSGNLMTQQWFKVAIWFIASAFFFAVAVIMISVGGPDPSKQQVEAFMAGMMQAMKNSLMGIAAMDSGGQGGVVEMSVPLFTNLLVIAFVLAAYLVWRNAKSNGSS